MLFIPILCFISGVFLLSVIIMHASFVFTKYVYRASSTQVDLRKLLFFPVFILITSRETYLLSQICFYIFKHILCITSYQENYCAVIYFQSWMWILLHIISVYLTVPPISLLHLMYSRLYLGNKKIFLSTLASSYFYLLS